VRPLPKAMPLRLLEQLFVLEVDPLRAGPLGELGQSEGQRRHGQHDADQGEDHRRGLRPKLVPERAGLCTQLVLEGGPELGHGRLDVLLDPLEAQVDPLLEPCEVVPGGHVGPAHGGQMLYQRGRRIWAEHFLEPTVELMTGCSSTTMIASCVIAGNREESAVPAPEAFRNRIRTSVRFAMPFVVSVACRSVSEMLIPISQQ